MFNVTLKQNKFHDHLSELVLHELRIDLVSELHKVFKPTTQINHRQTHNQQRCLRTSTPCTLQTFSSISREIHTSSMSTSTCFFPAFPYTQNPSLSIQRFTIYFRDIQSLSSALGFNDHRDFQTLHWRERSHDNNFCIRVIGSLNVLDESYHSLPPETIDLDEEVHGVNYSADTQSDERGESSGHGESSAYVASSSQDKTHVSKMDAVFVGISANASIVDNNDNEDPPPQNVPETPDTPTTAADDRMKLNSDVITKKGLVLIKKRTLWDEESHCYLSPWESIATSIATEVPPPEYFQRKDRKLDGIFALRWESKSVPRTTAWTTDAVRSGPFTLGRLEVVVPWVLVSGDQSTEVGDILTKQIFPLRDLTDQ